MMLIVIFTLQYYTLKLLIFKEIMNYIAIKEDIQKKLIMIVVDLKVPTLARGNQFRDDYMAWLYNLFCLVCSYNHSDR